MKKPLRATEIFFAFDDIIRTKDPGHVIQELDKKGWKTQVWCIKTQKYPDKKFPSEVLSLGKPFFLKTTWKLIRESKKIDLLILFHTHPLNPFYSIVYKLRNKNGTIYLKSDMDNTVLNIKKTSMLNIIRRIKLWANMQFIDLFSTEQERVYELLQKMYPAKKKKMFLLPNAYSESVKVPAKSFEQKKNIILCVGPVGSRQKGTDIILKTFALLKNDLRDWKIIMVGRIIPTFKPELELFFKNHPELKDRIEFKGQVSNRKETLELFNQAKIMFMPSRWETFSLALLEAANYSNVIVGTPVGGVPELTGNGKYGALCKFADCNALAAALRKRINNQKLLKIESLQSKINCDKNYNWAAISNSYEKRLRDAVLKKMNKTRNKNK